MNRSKTMTLAAQAMLSAFASASILNDTRHAGDPPLGKGICYNGNDSNPDAGGTDIKKDDGTVVAKGETVRDGTEGTEQHQAETASAAAPGTETLSAKKVDDAAALGTGEVKAAIGDPGASDVASQLG